jgi:peptide/nickel transport system substrate-binding protein
MLRLGLLTFAAGCVWAATELRFALRTDPGTLDPLLATDESAEAIGYLTGGVLIRLNRQTQQLEGELATTWKVRDGGRRIDFVLRHPVECSDGTQFNSQDVVATIRRMADPNLHSAIADSFRAGTGEIKAEASSPHEVSIFFTAAVANVASLFDQVAIPCGNSKPQAGVLGPFMVTEYKSGQYILLRHNPHYWKFDGGNRLPRAASIRLDILTNRETELLRFRKGGLHFLDKLDPEMFDRLRKEMPAAAVDAGASLDSEMMWFNETPNAPFPAHRQEWFQSKTFRRALSMAIQRDDMVRLVYRGHADAAIGPVSQSNKIWFNSSLRPWEYDPRKAIRLLEQDRFRFDGQVLRDHNGNAVEFSLITNAGSKIRMQLATMVQQDFKKIGIKLNVTPLEFQSLVERITRTRDYESCLLGLTNVELDPNQQMNFWQSSSTHHAWNPGQKSPATGWEAAIDELMKVQATAASQPDRKRAFDRVQEIVFEEAPVLYLINPHVLVAVSPAVRNAAPSALPPHLFWNIEKLALVETAALKGK